MNKQRENWVDIVKGIGIILVVMGHAGCPVLPHGIIYSFHMPLFFFLSGLFIKRQCEKDFCTYVKKNFRSLLLPYFYFNILSIIFYYIMSCIFHKELLLGSVQDNLIGIFVGMRFGSPYHHLLWFLPCLFFAKIIVYPMIKLFQKRLEWVKLMLSSIALVIGLTYSSCATKPLPLSFDASLVAAFFIVLGDYYMKTKTVINKYVGKYWNIVLILVALSIIYNFNKVEMFNMTYGNWGLFLLGSLSIILLICYFCGRILYCNKFWRFVMDYGRFSLLVFATHNYCLFVPITMKNRLLPSSSLWQDYIYWVVSIIICLMLVLPISKLINNKAKWLIGK